MADDTTPPRRIDKGIPRGRRPRNPPAAPTDASASLPSPQDPPQPASPASRAILAGVDPQAILDRYAQGDDTATIATAYEVNRRTLLAWLIRESEGNWQQLQIVRALDEYEQAKQALNTAPHALALARARERVRAAQWELERLWPKVWGQRAQIEHTVKRSLTERLQRAEERLVGESSTASIPAPFPVSTEGEGLES